ncbi:hypothetical protein IAR50_003722 [Cryptococcus sp. DSM 104548]
MYSPTRPPLLQASLYPRCPPRVLGSRPTSHRYLLDHHGPLISSPTTTATGANPIAVGDRVGRSSYRRVVVGGGGSGVQGVGGESSERAESGEEETILGTSREDVRMTGESEESDSASVVAEERKADEDALMSLASKQKDARPKSRPSKPASIPIPASPSPQPIDAPPTLTTEKAELALKSSERPLESLSREEMLALLTAQQAAPKLTTGGKGSMVAELPLPMLLSGITGIPARARSYRFPLHDDTAVWCLCQVEQHAVAVSPIHRDSVQDWFQDWLNEADLHDEDIMQVLFPINWDWPEMFFTLTETGIRKLAKRQNQSRDLDVRRFGKVCLALSLLLHESPPKPVLISVTHTNIAGTTDEFVDLVEGWKTRLRSHYRYLPSPQCMQGAGRDNST